MTKDEKEKLYKLLENLVNSDRAIFEELKRQAAHLTRINKEVYKLKTDKIKVHVKTCNDKLH
jgi:hypothetical protein